MRKNHLYIEYNMDNFPRPEKPLESIFCKSIPRAIQIIKRRMPGSVKAAYYIHNDGFKTEFK